MRIFYTLLKIRDWFVSCALQMQHYACLQAKRTYFVNLSAISTLQQLQQGYENDNEKIKDFLSQNRVEV